VLVLRLAHRRWPAEIGHLARRFGVDQLEKPQDFSRLIKKMGIFVRALGTDLETYLGRRLASF